MAQPDDQNQSGLRVSGYGPRIRQTAIVVIVLGAVVAAIVLAAMWSNRQEPEVGVQPTPRATEVPQPSPTSPSPDTPTPEPTAQAEVQVLDTETPTPTKTPVEDTPTSEPEKEPEATEEPPTSTPSPTATEVSITEVMPTEQPTAEPTDTPVPATEIPTAVPTATATHTPVPKPTATPTIAPTPIPTSTPTVTPTPTPSVPSILEIKARGQLIDQDIEQSDIKVLTAVEHTWPDLTLGCGPIEGDNPARLVDGWVLVLGNDEKTYRFHVASRNQEIHEDLKTKDDIIRNCTDVEGPEQLTVNLVHDLRLHEARRVVLYRGPASGEQAPVQDIKDGARIQAILDALNTNTPIGNTSTCETAYRLDFYILRGIQTIRFFCGKDWYRVGGEQEVWGGTQGALPAALLDAVAPYLAAEPLPGLPTWTPEE